MGMRRWLVAGAIALLALPVNGNAEIINLTAAGSYGSGSANLGGTFWVEQINPQPTGSGVIDSFVRVQRGSNEPTSRGFNTDQRPLENWNQVNNSGTFTRSLLLSDIPRVLIGGIYYRQFGLDINQEGSDPLLSLNQIQIFQTNNANLTNSNLVQTEDVGKSAVLTFTSGATEVFQMSGLGASNAGTAGSNRDEIVLNYALNSGSGSGDMALYVEDALFNAGVDYVTLFSQFGNPPGSHDENAGYEEWFVARGEGIIVPGFVINPVPAPAGAILFGLGAVLMIGYRGRRILKPSPTV